MNSFYRLQIICLAISLFIAAKSFPQNSQIVAEEFSIHLKSKLSHDYDSVLPKILSILEKVNNNPTVENPSDYWFKESYTNQVWTGSIWQNDSSELFLYNHYNLISERRIRNWSGSQWQNKARFLFSYDTSPRLVEENFQHNLLGQWVDSSKTLYDYDTMGRLFTETTYEWTGSVWANWRLTTSTYDANVLSQAITQSWSGSSWENSSRTTYTYHNNDSTASAAFSIWLFGTWINLLQIVFSINSDGLLSELKIQYWDFVSGWANLTRLVLTYDNNLRLIEGRQQDWDGNTSSWVNYSRIISTYDSRNLLTLDIRELWNAGNWIVDARYEYLYDSFANRTDIIFQLWSSGNWINETRELYTYVLVTSIDETDQTPKDYFLDQNYPNPFNPRTIIKFSLPTSGFTTIKIYNSLGEEVAVLFDEESSVGVYKTEWNAAGFPSGIYFYQLRTTEYFETKKMLLMK